MMKTKFETMNSYFDEQIAACAARSQALLADDRTDESNFEKIRANVYDIFRTMLSVAVAAGKGDANAVRSFFQLIKLDTLAKIKDKFSEVWGDAQ